ncbi:unnamed protein product [Calicophoron daubneyi]|uniref:Nephrocystin-4 n=1 Tax=Calicophoron daubneyi TaxID=300641 RepID=A0AAV2T937_CALDB
MEASSNQLYFDADLHKNLEACCHLIPMNTIVSASRRIPGVSVPGGLNLGLLDPCVKVYLGELRIKTDMTKIESFEEEFCEVVRQDVMLRGSGPRSGTCGILRVSERRLKVLYHNRYRVVEPVPVVSLDLACSHGEGESFIRRKSISLLRKQTLATSQTGEMCLVARNSVELSMSRDPDAAIIFVMEYVLTEGNSERKGLDISAPTKAVFTVRWGVFTPFAGQSPISEEVGFIPISVILEGAKGVAETDGSFLGKSSGCSLSDFVGLEKRIRHRTCPDGSLCFENNTKVTLNFTVIGNACVGKRQELTKLPVVSPRTSEQAVEVNATTNMSNAACRVFDNEILDSPQPKHKPSLTMEPDSDLKQSHPCKSEPELPSTAQIATYTQLLQQLLASQAFCSPWASPRLSASAVGCPVPTFRALSLYEPIQPATTLPAFSVTNQGLSSPITIAYNSHSGIGLTRAAYARLYSAGFPQISTEDGEAAETVNPDEVPNPVKNFNLRTEAADRRSVNEIVFQFMAYSVYQSPMAKVPNDDVFTPEQVYFTFQFYRFPQITTENLCLGQELDDYPDMEGLRCHVLQKSVPPESVCSPRNPVKGEDMKKSSGLPGYQIVLPIDPNFLKPGEYEIFFNYLLHNNLHVDVWDGKSHLLVGTAAVELKHLCRQGREAVQVSYALDVMRNVDDIETEEGVLGTSRPSTELQGRLHVRLANVGRHSSSSAAAEMAFNHKQQQYLVNDDDVGGYCNFHGGSLSNAFLTRQAQPQSPLPDLLADSNCHVIRARRIASVSQELRDLLYSSESEPSTARNQPGSGDIRQQKLARLHAALQAVQGSLQPGNLVGHAALSGVKLSGSDRLMELNLIKNYREQRKREQIERMLSGALTVEHRIETSFGCTEFFEFKLKNPSPREETVYIRVEDDLGSTSLVVDPREVRAFKAAYEITTPTEDDLFALNTTDRASEAGLEQSTVKPITVFLKPNESVLIPIKYAESAMVRQSAIGDMTGKQGLATAETSRFGVKAFQSEDRTVQIYFKLSSSDKLIAHLILRVHVNPAIVDQTFRFFHPELSYLKKLVRLPPTTAVFSSAAKMANLGQTMLDSGQLWTRVSDRGVLTQPSNASAGECTDLLVKVGLSNAPQVREFLLALYVEPFQLRPVYVWRWVVHALHRVDATAILGHPPAPIGLLLRTEGLLPAGGSRRISVYTSHPSEVILGAEQNQGLNRPNQEYGELSFLVSPRAVYELKIKLAPKRTGLRNFQINVVDDVARKVIRSWMVCAEIKPPEVSKTFNIQLPLINQQGVSEMCHKRIAYKNPYSQAKCVMLVTDRPDLLQFKETVIQIEAAGTVQLGLRFLPQIAPSVQKLFVFVRDEQGNNEETFAIVAEYR